MTSRILSESDSAGSRQRMAWRQIKSRQLVISLNAVSAEGLRVNAVSDAANMSSVIRESFHGHAKHLQSALSTA
jgi:uncharacterized protein with FMN-binding domain